MNIKIHRELVKYLIFFMILLQSSLILSCFEDYTGNYANPSEYHLGNSYSDCDGGNGMVITSITPSTNIKRNDEFEINGSGFGTSELAVIYYGNESSVNSELPTSDSCIKDMYSNPILNPETIQLKVINVKLDYTSSIPIWDQVKTATKWSNCHSISIIP